VPKKHEYRVHCCRTQIFGIPGSGAVGYDIFDAQQKKRKTDIPDADVDWRIRNLDGGFIYARENVELPESVKTCALEVFSRLGLDFGAIDIIYNEKEGKAYALEVNTAPGLAGTTLDRYVEMIEGLLNA
jgi:hypothetical protein